MHPAYYTLTDWMKGLDRPDHEPRSIEIAAAELDQVISPKTVSAMRNSDRQIWVEVTRRRKKLSYQLVEIKSHRPISVLPWAEAS